MLRFGLGGVAVVFAAMVVVGRCWGEGAAPPPPPMQGQVQPAQAPVDVQALERELALLRETVRLQSAGCIVLTPSAQPQQPPVVGRM